MPRNVRNFWLEGSIDGRTSALSGGPQAASGGFVVNVKQRNRGAVTTAGALYGEATNGRLRLLWIAPDGTTTELNETER